MTKKDSFPDPDFRQFRTLDELNAHFQTFYNVTTEFARIARVAHHDEARLRVGTFEELSAWAHRRLSAIADEELMAIRAIQASRQRVYEAWSTAHPRQQRSVKLRDVVDFWAATHLPDAFDTSFELTNDSADEFSGDGDLTIFYRTRGKT